MDRVTQASVEKLAADLVVQLDEMMKDRWGERSGAIAVAFDDGDEVELGIRDNLDEPKSTLAELIELGPALFVCTSSLGNLGSSDPGSRGARQRVRVTMAVTQTTDVSLIRHQDGGVQRIDGGATGVVYDLMRLVVGAPVPRVAR